MGPIPDPRYKSMLDRIDMDVIDMTPTIVLIADRVLPITPLPDAALPLGGTASRNRLTGCAVARKRRLNQPPARCKIPVALGERPDRMQMIRENNYRVDREWMTSMSLAKRKA